GLLHDVGRLVLAMRFRDEYWRVVGGAGEVQSIHELEAATFGVDHAEVAGWMLEAWSLPPTIVDAVRLHHNPGAATGIAGLLAVLAGGHPAPQCGREIAEALVRQLALESCALVLSEQRDGEPTLAGVAGRPIDESCWLALAALLEPGAAAACFRRTRDAFEAIAPGELAGEGFLVLPLAVGGEAAG